MGSGDFRAGRELRPLLDEPPKGTPMTIQVGEKIPDVTIKTSGMKDLSTGALCAGKKVVVFAVPGAFTPPCSEQHFPGFIESRPARSAVIAPTDGTLDLPH